MSDELYPLEIFVQGLVESLHPSSRSILAKNIAKKLRASQANRIAEQKNPDGTQFAPRKKQKTPKQGKIRRVMFRKIRLNRYLKSKSNANAVSIYFDKKAERIAKVHQFGLRDRVNKIRNIEVKYEERQLLGFSEADLEMIEDEVIAHLAD